MKGRRSPAAGCGPRSRRWRELVAATEGSERAPVSVARPWGAGAGRRGCQQTCPTPQPARAQAGCRRATRPMSLFAYPNLFGEHRSRSD